MSYGALDLTLPGRHIFSEEGGVVINIHFRSASLTLWHNTVFYLVNLVILLSICFKTKYFY